MLSRPNECAMTLLNSIKALLLCLCKGALYLFRRVAKQVTGLSSTPLYHGWLCDTSVVEHWASNHENLGLNPGYGELLTLILAKNQPHHEVGWHCTLTVLHAKS